MKIEYLFYFSQIKYPLIAGRISYVSREAFAISIYGDDIDRIRRTRLVNRRLATIVTLPL